MQSRKRIRIDSIHDNCQYCNEYIYLYGMKIKFDTLYSNENNATAIQTIKDIINDAINNDNFEILINISFKLLSILELFGNDLLDNIISFLPITEYSSLCLVCKTFKSLMYDPKHYKYFKLRIDARYHQQIPFGILLFESMPIITLSSHNIYSNCWRIRLRYIQYLFLYIDNPHQIDIFCDIFGTNHPNLQYLSIQINFIDETKKICNLLKSFQTYSTVELLFGDNDTLNYYSNYQNFINCNKNENYSGIPKLSSSDFGIKQSESLRFLQLIGMGTMPNPKEFNFSNILALSLVQIYFDNACDINMILSNLRTLIYLCFQDTTWNVQNDSVDIPSNILCLGCINLQRSPINFTNASGLIYLSYDEIPEQEYVDGFFRTLSDNVYLPSLKEFLWYSYPDDNANQKIAPYIFKYLSQYAPKLKYFTIPKEKCINTQQYFNEIKYELIPKYFNQNQVILKDKLSIPNYTSLFPVIPYLFTIFSASESRLKQIKRIN